ncbi:methyltransferase domain-containing protein [Candidatus Parcubacteria bacterium]|jgi:hypothetical protein|nr:MAG: methyltransferase domain-containing protein [Candidatus Parcubacteria bacterium]
MEKNFIKKNSCSSCGGKNLIQILDLGMMPLANAFLNEEELKSEEKKFPLTVAFCNDCALLQIMDLVNPSILFKEYDYITSASAPLIPHFEGMARTLTNEFIKSKNDLFVDVGGNDGTLLAAIKDNCRVLNIDPAENIAPLSRERGVETLSDFFGTETAKKVIEKYGSAKVVTANNVFAHIADIRDAFAGAGVLIGEDGILVVEVHWVGNLIGDGGFDQIYHEHLCYWSLTALKNLVNSLGMDIFRVELIPFHGQSMRVFISKNRTVENSVLDLLKKEKEIQLDKKEAFLNFGEKVEKNKKILRDKLYNLKKEGKSIVAYGAPAKGNTLLNYFELTPEVIDYATDTTPMKQGKFTPGVRIPVFSPEKAKKEVPDYFLLLAWNYADAIMKNEDEFRKNGGKFIIPVPEMWIV